MVRPQIPSARVSQILGFHLMYMKQRIHGHTSQPSRPSEDILGNTGFPHASMYLQ